MDLPGFNAGNMADVLAWAVIIMIVLVTFLGAGVVVGLIFLAAFAFIYLKFYAKRI